MELGRVIEWASNIYYTYFLPWKEVLQARKHQLSVSTQHPALCPTSYISKYLLSESTSHHFISALLGCMLPWLCLDTSFPSPVSSSCIKTSANVCICLRNLNGWKPRNKLTQWQTLERQAHSEKVILLGDSQRWNVIPEKEGSSQTLEIFKEEWKVYLE